MELIDEEGRQVRKRARAGDGLVKRVQTMMVKIMVVRREKP